MVNLLSVKAPCSAKPGFRWRIDLTKTEHYWPGWFHNLSAKFLDIPVAKLLLLAGIDRLDRELTVGQMQGEVSFSQYDNLFHCWLII